MIAPFASPSDIKKLTNQLGTPVHAVSQAINQAEEVDLMVARLTQSAPPALQPRLKRVMETLARNARAFAAA